MHNTDLILRAIVSNLTLARLAMRETTLNVGELKLMHKDDKALTQLYNELCFVHDHTLAAIKDLQAYRVSRLGKEEAS
jgi:hypothetical protein